MEKTINLLNSALIQAKVLHINTLIHSQHLALEYLYTSLGESLDALIESYLALKRLKNPKYIVEFSDIELADTSTKQATILFYFDIYGKILKAKSELKGAELGLEVILDDIVKSLLLFIYKFQQEG